MDEDGLARVREQLQEFAEGIFAGLPRVDQRETGLRRKLASMGDGREIVRWHPAATGGAGCAGARARRVNAEPTAQPSIT